MAFNTEGWRKIVIEEQVFFWQADEWAPELFRARPEREPHRLLRVGCGRCVPADGFFRSATPGVVRAGIECALRNGWLADRPVLRLIAFDNPLRYVSLQPGWFTPTVAALAIGIDAEQVLDQLPILADALQDAGCDNPDILDHCREPHAAHVRGCWVVDLALGKQ